MSRPIETAVILAAGLGSRLGDIKKGKPKAFLEIDGISLIERSIAALRGEGIKQIIIGTGYESQHFDELRSIYPEIETHKNLKFDASGSMYTLFLLKHLISKPFLLLEGDLLYEPSALRILMDEANDDIILASTATHSGDEVFIEVNQNGMLQKMSKRGDELNSVHGELVGISKLSLQGFSAMCQFAESKYEAQDFGIHYEDAMVGASSAYDFNVKLVDDLAWCEIDDQAHLTRALNDVYPKIKQRSRS